MSETVDLPESEHSDPGPSGLERVVHCPGSLLLARGTPDEAGYDAKLGTAAHWLGAECLTEERNASFFAGTKITVAGEEFEVDDDMIDAVQVHVDFVRRLPGDMLLVERRVDVPVVGIWGTADIIKYDAQSKTLFVVDYKHGKGVFVPVDDNHQLRAYAWGAYNLLCVVEDIEHIEVTIVQPRIDNIATVRCTPSELEAWAYQVAPIVLQARNDPNAPLKTGDHCGFCRAKSKCPEVRKLVVDTTGIEFVDLSSEMNEAHMAGDPDEVRGLEMASALEKLDLIEDWCKEMRAAANRHLSAGKPLPGYKLVEGRRGNRKWANPKHAEMLLKEKFRLPVDDIYEREVIGPAAAERLLAESSPRRWKQLTALITQSPGRPSVVPVGDKRPAIIVAPVKFDDLSAEEPIA